MAAFCSGVELVVRGAHLAQRGGDPVQKVAGLVVAVMDECGVRGMEGDPRTGRLADSAGEPVVVGMDVGDHDALDVADIHTDLVEAR